MKSCSAILGLWVAAMCIAGGAVSPAVAQSTNAPTSLDYEYYRLISERNIFNQNRSPARSRNNEQRSPAERADTLSYVGFIHYDKGLFAFFDGSSSDYRKDLTIGGQVAGFKVVAITPQSVTLEREGNQMELKAGHELRRRPQGEWQVAEGSQTSASASNGDGTSSAVEPLNVGSGPQSDVLKALMQRRAQEGQ